MPRVKTQPSHSPPIKAACLACRAAKIRCDGENPCSRCSWKKVNCLYRPSRRGGIRRRPLSPKNDARTAAPSNQLNPLSSLGDPAVRQGLSSQGQSTANLDPSSAYHGLENVYDLLNPLGGICNLDIPSDVGTALSSTSEVPFPVRNVHGDIERIYLRTYSDDKDIVNAYYVYIHPYIPILPRPNRAQYDDRPVMNEVTSDDGRLEMTTFPWYPRSSLTLAISAVLALIPSSEYPYAYSSRAIQMRREQAHLYAKDAFEVVDKEIHGISAISPALRFRVSDEAGVHLQSGLESVLTLVMLSVYEYCQRGNISRMRSRANQALTMAMDLSLHKLGSKATETQRRTWWSTMLVVHLSSIDQQTLPIITLNDPRITTPFPSLCDLTQEWPLLLEAEGSIIKVSEVSKQYRMSAESGNLLSDLSERIMGVHSQLSDLIRRLDQQPNITPETGTEAKAATNVWTIARLLVHSARIRLHRARAFRDIPMFLEQHCDLAALQDKRETLPELDSASLQDLDSVFPFTEQQSSLMCFKSSLVISRALETLPLHQEISQLPFDGISGKTMQDSARPPTPYMLPFFVCAAMQSSYVLLTSHYRVRAALESGNLSIYSYLFSCPEPDSETQDAERFLREVRQAMESIIGAMKFAQMFEGVGGMSHEILLAYQAATSVY